MTIVNDNSNDNSFTNVFGMFVILSTLLEKKRCLKNTTKDRYTKDISV